MTKKLDMYRCNICGNFVEVMFPGEGELVCCGQPMEHIKLHTKEEEMTSEKHVPVVKQEGENVEIRVGEVPHPMDDNHYIMFIEAVSEDKNYLKRKYLYPGDEALLKFKCNCDKVIAREFCNIHGLWTS